MRFVFLLLLTIYNQYSLAAKTSETCHCDGKPGKIWMNQSTYHGNAYKGGCVSDGAYVARGVIIEENAKVCGGAEVSGTDIKIYGDAKVLDDTIIEGKKIRIGGGAILRGNVEVGSNTRIRNTELTSGYYENTRINGKDYSKEQQIENLQSSLNQALKELSKKTSPSEFDLSYQAYFPSNCLIKISGQIKEPGSTISQQLTLNLTEETIKDHSPIRGYSPYWSEQKGIRQYQINLTEKKVETKRKITTSDNRSKESHFNTSYFRLLSDLTPKHGVLEKVRSGLKALEKACHGNS